jgi:hypothetical protein
MEKGKFREILAGLSLQREKWLTLHEVESIVLKSGRGVYPSWKFLRFMVTHDDRIIVRHGKSVPYGARISGLSMISGDMKSLYFSPSKDGVQIESSPLYGEFRQPRVGDTVRVTEGLGVSHGEALIVDRTAAINAVILTIAQPLHIPRTGKLSFYDTSVYSDSENCVHSSVNEGVYMHFQPNQSKRKYRGHWYHEEIRPSDVQEIRLSVGGEYYSKNYKIT